MSGERKTTRRQAIAAMLAAGGGLILYRCRSFPTHEPQGDAPYDSSKHLWGYAVDTEKCIGCGNCMRACRIENNVPTGYHRTWVERYHFMPGGEIRVDVADEGDHAFEPVEGPQPEKAYFVPKLCNHCEKSVCDQVCPVGASYSTPDGVALIDQKHCVGCGYCVQACPYGCRFINPGDHVADKCTFCYHRITKGLPPACVQACPTEARIYGDLRDPTSHLSMLLKQRRYEVLKPHMGTHPRVHYSGLDQEVV